VFGWFWKIFGIESPPLKGADLQSVCEASRGMFDIGLVYFLEYELLTMTE